MFGFQNDELAVLVGGAFLALRMVVGLGQVIWWYETDSARVITAHVRLSLLTAIASAMLSVGVVSIATGGMPQLFRIPVYIATATVWLFLGMMFDLLLSIQLYWLSNWLMALRIPHYRERLLHGDAQVRLHAAKQLGTLGWRARPARPELLAAFRDESAEMRAAVAYAILIAIPDPPDDDVEVQKAARSLLTDSTSPVRVYGAAILVAYRTPATVLLPVFIDGLKCDDVNVSGLSCRAVGQIGPAAEPAIPALRELALLADTENSQPIDALQKLGAPAVPALIEILDRGTSTLKWQAIKALGNMGEAARDALPALRKLAIQRITLVSDTAKKAVRKLGGDIG